MPDVHTVLPYVPWNRQFLMAWPVLPGVQNTTGSFMNPRNTQ
jgi:hypothetical protein